MEVYHNGEWGTVCDDGWDLNDAQVVCNELEIGDVVFVRHNSFYGQGSGRIWLINLRCNSTEWTFGNCIQGHHYYCSHYEDAGVKCATGNNISNKHLAVNFHMQRNLWAM